MSVKKPGQIDPSQTQPSHVGLSASVVAAQQKLSEQYNIVTFDTKGNISTVPANATLDNLNNEGTGGDFT